MTDISAKRDSLSGWSVEAGVVSASSATSQTGGSSYPGAFHPQLGGQTHLSSPYVYPQPLQYSHGQPQGTMKDLILNSTFCPADLI